ncbi:hypothetical protein GEMRC1_002272 [Eukaryota sp. GEM-RC1]
MGCSSSKSIEVASTSDAVTTKAAPTEDISVDDTAVEVPVNSPQAQSAGESPTEDSREAQSPVDSSPKSSFAEILSKIKANDSVSVSFSDCSPSEDEIQQLADYLCDNTSVRQLKLINVKIPTSCYTLVQKILSQSSLDEVILNQCNLGDVGAKAVLSSAAASSLSSLSLENNGITTAVIDDIIDVIEKSPVLYRFNLSNNSLDADALTRIQESCKSNAVLEQVIVCANDPDFVVSEEDSSLVV